MSHRLLGTLLLLWCLAASFASSAEAIHPRLSKAAFDSLLAQLPRSRPDTNRVQLLLRITDDLLLQNDDLGTDLQPALAYVQQAATLSDRLHFAAGRVGSLLLLGQVHEYLEQDTLGKVLIRRGIAQSQQEHLPRLEALGWVYLGESYGSSPAELAAKLSCYQRSNALFRQLGAKEKEAYTLKCVADVHLQQGHSAQAVRELLAVEALYRAAGNRRMHYTYDLLHATYRQMGDYKEALRYGLAAVESAQATQDTIILAGLWNRLAVACHELKKYPESMAYYQKALENYQHNGNTINVISMVGHIVRIMVLQGRAQEGLAFLTKATKPYAKAPPRIMERIADYNVQVHSALRHYAVAERYANQLVSFLQSGTADDGEKTAVCLTLGRFYLLTKRYDEARQYLQQVLALNQHSGPVLRRADIHLLLFKADSAQGRFPTAIAHYQRYKLLNDSVFNEAKNKQLASLEIQYDTRKKEQNIALLTKQNQVQQARIRQREVQRNATLAGAVMLVLLLGLGYNRYRLKQRSNQLLEAKQTEINQQNKSLARVLGEKSELLAEKEWMLKEIHHRVKNNLQIVSSLLATQSDYLLDPQAVAAIRESQNRVQAMALLHQKLYQADSLARVNMAEYCQEIVENLLHSFDCQDAVQPRFTLDAVELDVVLATPVGLIINEVVTNALKHAFPPPRRGTLGVELIRVGAQRYQLTIADDGVGLPPSFDVERSRSLGLTIIRGLSRQIDGVLDISQADGVRVSLQFETTKKPSRVLAA
ncbi:sensor histidine kinase [Hymenobacter crusticola]|uniref:histidine kinase n=1 Tax=Hymenobacter crusticola TaxID=1770526 RepID=A0A243WKL1_9BACT|nr:histidine kinase dimerization/phosphoacceptor domain -containing protein [Hymenobacter crusticola]OUJ75877.1 hypothetical protein BXP70_00850 [Hymenobacter crusticola]